MTTTATALEAFLPTLEERFVSFVTRTFERYVEEFGPALRGINNSRYYTNWANNVRPFTKRQGVGSMNDPIAINEGYLAAKAKEYAAATVAAWAVKIDAKLGELENATLVRGGGNSFVLSGTKGGRAVRIEQDMIVNVSPKGTLFNQFPARIYVDGKFTPAAKFAAM